MTTYDAFKAAVETFNAAVPADVQLTEQEAQCVLALAHVYSSTPVGLPAYQMKEQSKFQKRMAGVARTFPELAWRWKGYRNSRGDRQYILGVVKRIAGV